MLQLYNCICILSAESGKRMDNISISSYIIFNNIRTFMYNHKTYHNLVITDNFNINAVCDNCKDILLLKDSKISIFMIKNNKTMDMKIEIYPITLQL